MTAAVSPAHDQTQERPRGDVLLRRQVVLSVATVALMLGAVVLLRWHASLPSGIRYDRVGDQFRMRAAETDSARTIMRPAMAQVVLSAVLAVIALGHAAGVIRYVFSRNEVT